MKWLESYLLVGSCYAIAWFGFKDGVRVMSKDWVVGILTCLFLLLGWFPMTIARISKLNIAKVDIDDDDKAK